MIGVVSLLLVLDLLLCGLSWVNMQRIKKLEQIAFAAEDCLRSMEYV